MTRLLRSRILRGGFLVAAVGLAAWAVVQEWDSFSQTATRFGPSVLLLVVSASATNILTSGVAWHRLLAASGSPLAIGTALRIFLLGQLGKYLPGSVWAVLAQAELASDLHVPRSRTLGASTVALGMSVVVGVAFAVPLATVWLTGDVVWWTLMPAVLALGIMLHPRVLNWSLERLMAVLRRPAPTAALTTQDVVVAATWTVLSWLALGAQLFVLLLAAGAPADGGTALVALSGYALAWVVGFAVVFAPAGAGAREVVLVAVLSPLVGTGEALAVALVSRILTTVTDVGLASGAAAVSRVASSRRTGDRSTRSSRPPG